MTPFRITSARFLLPCFLAVGYCLLPNAASAEGRCPPGMFETGSRDFIGCAPIPGYDQGGNDGGDDAGTTPAPPTRPSKPGFMVAVYHADTGSVWTSAGNQTVEGARQHALGACNAATGGGCYVAETLDRIGRIFVAEDAMGQLWIKADVDDDKGPRFDVTQWNPSIEICLKNSFGCKFLGFHQSGVIYLDEDPNRDQSWNRYPNGKLSQKRWAMVAQPTKTPAGTGPNKSWLISGRHNSTATRKEVLDRCQTDSGAPCTISAYAAYSGEMAADRRVVGNGLLVHFVDARGKNRWTSAVSDKPKASKKKGAKALPDPVTVQDRIGRLCPPTLPCKVIATYDAVTSRVQVIEDAK